jgi:hypothetical protein
MNTDRSNRFTALAAALMMTVAVLLSIGALAETDTPAERLAQSAPAAATQARS